MHWMWYWSLRSAPSCLWRPTMWVHPSIQQLNLWVFQLRSSLQAQKFRLYQLRQHFETFLERREQAIKALNGIKASLKLQTLGSSQSIGFNIVAQVSNMCTHSFLIRDSEIIGLWSRSIKGPTNSKRFKFQSRSRRFVTAFNKNNLGSWTVSFLREVVLPAFADDRESKRDHQFRSEFCQLTGILFD